MDQENVSSHVYFCTNQATSTTFKKNGEKRNERTALLLEDQKTCEILYMCCKSMW